MDFIRKLIFYWLNKCLNNSKVWIRNPKQRNYNIFVKIFETTEKKYLYQCMGIHASADNTHGLFGCQRKPSFVFLHCFHLIAMRKQRSLKQKITLLDRLSCQQELKDNVCISDIPSNVCVLSHKLVLQLTQVPKI